MWSRMMFHCYTGTCLMMLGMNVMLIYSGLLSVNSCNVIVTHFRWRIALYSLQFFDWCLCNLCFCILNVCKMFKSSALKKIWETSILQLISVWLLDAFHSHLKGFLFSLKCLNWFFFRYFWLNLHFAEVSRFLFFCDIWSNNIITF